MPELPTFAQFAWYGLVLAGIAMGTFAYHWVKGETVKEKLDRLSSQIEADRAQTESLNRKMIRVEKHIMSTPSPLEKEPVTRSEPLP